jgi:hypothetical protein
MVSPTTSEKIVKTIITRELTTTKDSVIVTQFFKDMESVSLIKLFTKEGYDYIKNSISELEQPHDVIEFFYRIKSAVFTNEQFFKDVFNVVTNDKMFSTLLEDEYDFLEIKDFEELKEYYILCVIYAYNNTLLD